MFILYVFIVYFNHFYPTPIFKFACGVATLKIGFIELWAFIRWIRYFSKNWWSRGKTSAFIRCV